MNGTPAVSRRAAGPSTCLPGPGHAAGGYRQIPMSKRSMHGPE
jgi:hypothetical protein